LANEFRVNPWRWVRGAVTERELLQAELTPSEQLAWSGQPARRYFRKNDIIEFPFGIFWLAFSIFWTWGASGHFDHQDKNAAPWFGLFGVPFIAIGLYLVIGKFFYRRWKSSNTYFGITNKRVLVVTTVPRKKIVSGYLDSLPAITKSIGRNGIGTLQFGNPAPAYAYWSRFPWSAEPAQDVPTFYDIPDADNVFAVVSDLRDRALRGERRFGMESK
jgi:hypothetical protein